MTDEERTRTLTFVVVGAGPTVKTLVVMTLVVKTLVVKTLVVKTLVVKT